MVAVLNFTHAGSRPARLARLTIDRLNLHPPIDVLAAIHAADLPLHEVPIPLDVDGHLAYAPDIDQFGIFVNTRYRDPLRRRFTLAHELGHWILHRSFIRGARLPALHRGITQGAQPDLELLETEASQFAAELLMPAELVPWASTLAEPERFFRVSRAAWIRRLADLGQIVEVRFR